MTNATATCPCCGALEPDWNASRSDPAWADQSSEIERLRALTTRLRTAAEGVCWFDWSNNDQDAVEAITELRLALEGCPRNPT